MKEKRQPQRHVRATFRKMPIRDERALAGPVHLLHRQLAPLGHEPTRPAARLMEGGAA